MQLMAFALAFALLAAPASANVIPSWVVRHSTLADPSVPTIEVETGADLSAVLAAECGAGCILELAPGGVYDCGISIGGSANTPAWLGTHAGDVDPSGEVVIRGDPSAPAQLNAVIGSPLPCIYQLPMTPRLRLEHLRIDGRRSEQTMSAIGQVCADSQPDGICDSGESDTLAYGFYSRHTGGQLARTHLYDVHVREVLGHCLNLTNALDTTIEASSADGCGCTRNEECVGLTLPVSADSAQYYLPGRGISMNGRRVATIHSSVTRAGRMGVQCIGDASDCAIVGNRASLTAEPCFNAVSNSGTVLGRISIRGNFGRGCGGLTPFATPGQGPALATRSNGTSDTGPFDLHGNDVEAAWSFGAKHSGDTAVPIRSVGNRVGGNGCQDGVTTVMYDVSNRASGSRIVGDTVSVGPCDTGVRLYGGTQARVRGLTVTGTASDAGLRVDDATVDLSGVTAESVYFSASASGTANDCTGTVGSDSESMTGDCFDAPGPPPEGACVIGSGEIGTCTIGGS